MHDCHLSFSGFLLAKTWVKNLFANLLVLYTESECTKGLKTELLIIYYQIKRSDVSLFSRFLLAWISAVSSRKTSKSTSCSYRPVTLLEAESKRIMYHVDLSGRYFFVCQIKIVLHELIKQWSSDVTGRHYRLADAEISLGSLQLEETVEIQASFSSTIRWTIQYIYLSKYLFIYLFVYYIDLFIYCRWETCITSSTQRVIFSSHPSAAFRHKSTHNLAP